MILPAQYVVARRLGELMILWVLGWVAYAVAVLQARDPISFFDSLGDSKGYVIGAGVTAVALIINTLVLFAIEAYRSRKTDDASEKEWTRQQAAVKEAWARQQSAVEEAWNHERDERFVELRRETFADVVSSCERRWHWADVPEIEREGVITSWYGARGKVRFVTDRRDVIEAADRMSNAAGAGDADEFRVARTEFVRLSREELGLAAIPMETKLETPNPTD